MLTERIGLSLCGHGQYTESSPSFQCVLAGLVGESCSMRVRVIVTSLWVEPGFVCPKPNQIRTQYPEIPYRIRTLKENIPEPYSTFG